MGKKISQLYADNPATLPLTGDELIELTQGGVSKATKTSNLPGGGLSYLSYESYQNSAMSSAVDCFVYRDTSLAIWKVYEPTRNNTVSRSQFAYADSIDKIPFNNLNWYDNKLFDVKLINLQGKSILSGCDIQTTIIDASGVGSNPITFSSIDTGSKTFVINASFGDITAFFNQLSTVDAAIFIYSSTNNNGKYTIASSSFDATNTSIVVNESIPSSNSDGGISGLSLINHIQKGEFGDGSPNNAELYITGDNVYLIDNSMGCASYLDSVGDNSIISKSDIFGYVDGDLNDNGIIIDRCLFETSCGFSNNIANSFLSSCYLRAASFIDIGLANISIQNTDFGSQCYVNIINRITASVIGSQASVDTTNGTLSHSTISDNVTYNTPSNQSNVYVIKTGTTSYYLGESGGNATLTPV